MADYYPLISRAVAGLENNTGDARRVVYDRARNALVAQLRAIQPPLEEGDITRERLELEEAVRKIEAEEVEKAASGAPARSQSGGTSAPSVSPSGPPRRDNFQPAQPPRRTPPASERPQASERQPPAPRQSASPGAAPRPRSPSDRPSMTSEALKGFRDVVPDKAKFSGTEPPPPPFTPAPREPVREPYRARDTQGSPGREAPAAGLGLPREPAVASSRPTGDDRVPPAHYSGEDHGRGAPFHPGETPHGQERWRPEAHESANPETFDFPGAVGSAAEPRRPARSYWGVISIAVALLLIGGLGAGAYYAVSRPGGITSLFSSRSPAPPPQREAAAPTRGKITDRVGAPGQTTQQQQAGLPPQSGPGASPAAPVAQRVVLYEDEPDNPQGKQYVGSAIWRTEMVSPGPGQAPEMAVRADVQIPERKINMTWSLRRNTDQNLPASHTIEIMFNLPADFPHGGIANVPGIMMKQAEATRGVALAGLAVKVTNGYFLIGLSAVETDLQRNVQLLKERAWFDIPVLYNDNRRAILALEKGNPGERAFAEAFSTWVQ
jgi:hypothetical protein